MVSFDTYDVIFRQNQLCTKKNVIDLRLVNLLTTSLCSRLLLLTSLLAPIVIQMTWDIMFSPINNCFYRDDLNLGTKIADQISIFGRPNRCVDARKGMWLRCSRKRRSDPEQEPRLLSWVKRKPETAAIYLPLTEVHSLPAAKTTCSFMKINLTCHVETSVISKNQKVVRTFRKVGS